jgi:hypothetical protein
MATESQNLLSQAKQQALKHEIEQGLSSGFINANM